MSNEDISRDRISEALEESGGLWQPCSGCHETVDGQETGHYRYNDAFKCFQGSGCHECGGIGVVWNDYSEYPEPAAQLLQQGNVELLVNTLSLVRSTADKDDSGNGLFDVIISYCDQALKSYNLSVKGEEKEYITQEQFKEMAEKLDKPALNLIKNAGVPFEKWTQNILSLIEKELGLEKTIIYKKKTQL